MNELKAPGAANALLFSHHPSEYFLSLKRENALSEYFSEVAACVGVPQDPVHHPEGDVFDHTLLVLDCAAELREQARQPLGFMLAALTHDLGKTVATEVQPGGRITAYRHETLGLPLVRQQLRRLTDDEALMAYVVNMVWLHMRPNMLAGARSRKIRTRQLFDLSVCPEDLILLSRADASGKLDRPYDSGNEAFLRSRLADYRRIMARPRVTEADLLTAGVSPDQIQEYLARTRRLHLSGLEPGRALAQVLREKQ